MANIINGYTNDWYPKQEPIVPKAYHKYLKLDDLKNSYPDIFSDDEAATLQDRLDKVSNGSTVRLDKNYKEDIVIKAGRIIKLDLAGYTLTNKESDTITVEFGAALTIVGKGTIDNTTAGMAALYNNGITIIDGPTLTKSETEYYAVLNHGSLVVNSGVIKLAEGMTSSVLVNGYYDFGRDNPKYGYVPGVNMEAPTLYLEGGSVLGGRNAVKNDDNGYAYIDGGIVKGTQCNLFNVHKMNVKGGSFITPNLDGSTVEAYGTPGWCVYSKYYDGGWDDAVTIISGGEFAGDMYADGDEALTWIIGGKFDREVDYLPEGYHWEKIAGSYVPVVGNATVDEEG